MSVVSPKVFLRQDQLNDFLSVAMFLATAERTNDEDGLIGSEFKFNRLLAPRYGKGDELTAAAIEARIQGFQLPTHGRHWFVVGGDPDHVMQHVALSHTRPQSYSNSGLQRQEAEDRLQSRSVDDNGSDDQPGRRKNAEQCRKSGRSLGFDIRDSAGKGALGR